MFRLLVMPEICFLFLHGWNLKFSNQTCHFMASHHPTPQCCRVLSQTHTPTITLHRGIILFMSMVNRNTREHVCCFLDALRKVSLTGGMPQKKHVLVEGGASSIDWRVNFLEAAVLSSMRDFLFSARSSFVWLNYNRQEPWHLAWCCRKVVSMPTPSSNLDRLIVLGKQPTLSKPLILSAIVL